MNECPVQCELFITEKTLTTVNCKNTFEGVYHFTYEWDIGGGGICNSPHSQLVACQEPGSPYVDNEVFTMSYGKCPEVTTSENKGKHNKITFNFVLLETVL